MASSLQIKRSALTGTLLTTGPCPALSVCLQQDRGLLGCRSGGRLPRGRAGTSPTPTPHETTPLDEVQACSPPLASLAAEPFDPCSLCLCFQVAIGEDPENASMLRPHHFDRAIAQWTPQITQDMLDFYRRWAATHGSEPM